MSSLAQRIYDAAPVPLQHALLTAYGWHLRRLRYGAGYRRVLQELLESQWQDAATVAQHQVDTLASVLDHARRTVPFYANRLPAVREGTRPDLREIPLLTKHEVREAGEALVSTTYRGRRLQETHTGGTTGMPLTIYCTPAVLQRNYAFFARFVSWTGVGPSERRATFAGRNIIPARLDDSGTYWRYNWAARTLLCSSYHLSPQHMTAYAEALRRFRPALIDSYPSSILPLATYLVEHPEVRLGVRAIVTSSETLDLEARGRLERAFGCPVFDHYGAAEMAAFITQCEHGTYHANPEFGVVEIVDERGAPVAPGETGQVVATGFINDAMPLIRYVTGDLAVQGSGTCACGRAFPVIQRIIGRQDDVVITPDGRRVGRLDPIFKVTNGIHETQIIQDRRDHIRVEIVPTSGYQASDGEVLRQELARRLGPTMSIEVVLVPSIPRAASGKLRTVVNLVDRDHGERAR